MALTIGDRDVRPLTADEVLRMVDAGILGEDDRVELLGGMLTRVSPKGREHEAVKERLLRWLAPGLADGRYAVRAESGLAVPDHTSLPEPDIAVFEPGHDELELPVTALLVVEVAVTSQRTDTEVKPALYAAAGVPEYWVTDVRGRRLHVFEEPSGGEYRRARTVHSGAAAPLSIGVEPLELAELFAAL